MHFCRDPGFGLSQISWQKNVAQQSPEDRRWCTDAGVQASVRMTGTTGDMRRLSG
jgi:hypothetical protein